MYSVVVMTLGELYQLGRRLRELAETAMSGGPSYDLSPAENIVMGDLISHPESTVSEIAARTGFVQSRISTAVGSLRDRGWLQTSTDDTDRRRKLVTVSPKVQRGVTEAHATSAEAMLADALSELSPRRRAALIADLEELHRTLVVAELQPEPSAGVREARTRRSPRLTAG